MRTQIAFALLALVALAVLVLVARSRSRRTSRPSKHLRIDLLPAEGEQAPPASRPTQP